MLTDRFIRSAKPGTYADEGGLYLRVRATTKAFIWRRSVGGKDTWETLGHYPAMGLAEAREVVEKRKAGKVSKRTIDAWVAYYNHLKTQFRDPGQVERMFEKDILPRLGHLALDDIPKAVWADTVNRVVQRGSPVMANRLLTQAKRFLAYCKDHGWVDANHLHDVARRNLGGREVAKDRNLSFDEIAHFLSAMPSWGVSDGTAWALFGCLLTGLRATEVLNVSKDGVVTTKMNRQHRIPKTRYVSFWLAHRPTTLPKDHRVLSHALRRVNQTFTPHDLRRTFASRLADLGALPHVIEKMLDHQMTGVMAVYNRADYWPERLAAQKLWDNALRKRRPRSKLDGG